MIVDKYAVTTLGGREVKMVFTTAAYIMLCDRHGGIAELGDAMRATDAAGMRETLWIAALLANQGLMLERQVTSLSEQDVFNVDKLAAVTLPFQIKTINRAVMEAITFGVKGERLPDSDEAEVDVVLEELNAEKKPEGGSGPDASSPTASSRA